MRKINIMEMKWDQGEIEMQNNIIQLNIYF